MFIIWIVPNVAITDRQLNDNNCQQDGQKKQKKWKCNLPAEVCLAVSKYVHTHSTHTMFVDEIDIVWFLKDSVV